MKIIKRLFYSIWLTLLSIILYIGLVIIGAIIAIITFITLPWFVIFNKGLMSRFNNYLIAKVNENKN